MKIFVVGQSGSGKSTFSKQLAQEIGVPYLELDPIWLKTGAHKYSGSHAIRKQGAITLEKEVKKLLRKHKQWVVDGNYRNVRPILMKQADLIIQMDLPLTQRLWNNLKRQYGGEKKVYRFWSFHIPRLITRSKVRQKQLLAQIQPHSKKIIQITSHGKADLFLENVKTSHDLKEIQKNFRDKK